MARMTFSSSILAITCIATLTLAAQVSSASAQHHNASTVTGPLTEAPIPFDWLEVPAPPLKNVKPVGTFDQLGIVDCRIFDRVRIIKESPTSVEAKSASTQVRWASLEFERLKTILVDRINERFNRDAFELAKSWNAINSNLHDATVFFNRSRISVREYLAKLQQSQRQRILDLVDARIDHSETSIRFHRIRNQWVRDTSPKNLQSIATANTKGSPAKPRYSNIILSSFPASKDFVAPTVPITIQRFSTSQAKATEDAYWQYYDDCDYWKVDFGQPAEANLITANVTPKELSADASLKAQGAEAKTVQRHWGNVRESLRGWIADACVHFEKASKELDFMATPNWNYEAWADSIEFMIFEY